jgi:long-chain fatty acid transport protein
LARRHSHFSFQIRENSASALGNAFAGAAASSEDPRIIANNPAGMIGLSGNQVSGDIGIIIPSAVFFRNGPHCRTATYQRR